MLGIWAGPAAAQESFGRLFFTPAQRQQLDDLRRKPAAPEPVRESRAAPEPPPAQSLSIDGIVRRNDGQATVWVNRTPTQAPQRAGAVRIGPVRDASDGADLRLPDNGRQVRIKVGQEVDVQSGRIQERYRQPQPASVPQARQDDTAARTVAPSEAAPREVVPREATTRDAAPRDAAVERILRELGRRLDEKPPAQDPAR
jgi:hypothetical protein